MKDDIVNPPYHYASSSIMVEDSSGHNVRVEPWELSVLLPHALGSAFEYIIRAGKKEGVTASTDLKKARWWIQRATTYTPAAFTQANGLLPECAKRDFYAREFGKAFPLWGNILDQNGDLTLESTRRFGYALIVAIAEAEKKEGLNG